MRKGYASNKPITSLIATMTSSPENYISCMHPLHSCSKFKDTLSWSNDGYCEGQQHLHKMSQAWTFCERKNADPFTIVECVRNHTPLCYTLMLGLTPRTWLQRMQLWHLWSRSSLLMRSISPWVNVEASSSGILPGDSCSEKDYSAPQSCESSLTLLRTLQAGPLNDMLMVGKHIHPPLLDVSLHFRVHHQIAPTVNVSKMCRAVQLVVLTKTTISFC